jgi:hypothetical protein
MSLWLNWVNGCVPLKGYGLTASDSMHCGLRDYSEPFPCPNGLTATTDPRESISYQNRIAKAKRDIEAFDRESHVRALALAIKPQEVQDDIKDIKLWLQSLFSPPSQTGSPASKKAGGN